jgi:hypothetical protein
VEGVAGEVNGGSGVGFSGGGDYGNVSAMLPVYHITHVDNCGRIIRARGLWCDAERFRQHVESVDIAYRRLKDRRSRVPVPVAAGGTLADYVPFYFANRSPMLFAIHAGQVEGYAGGQEQVVYLTSTVESIVRGDRRWAFTDGHAVETLTRFYDSLDHLDQIDWAVVNHWSWKNTEADPDRKRRKQAEFLVHGFVPWTLCDRIGVANEAVCRQVRQVLDESGVDHRPRVVIEPKWYY